MVPVAMQAAKMLASEGIDTEVTNFGEHLLRRTAEELFYELHAPPRLLAGAHVPQLEQVVSTLRELARHEV